MLEFRVLGPVEVVAASGPLPLGGQKQRALLTLLLLHAGEAVAAERIIEELWDAEPPPTAATALTNLVSQLRKLLGAEAIVTRPPGYLLQVERDRLDSARFERLIKEARGAEAAERAQKLGEALALWRGPPLADMTYAAFAQGEIRRLEELRLAALEERIEAELELGRRSELVGELEGLVAQNPLRERLRGQLMLALYGAGRQAEALDAYHDARRTLVEELGIEPSPLLQQLYRSILRQEVTLQPATTAGEPVDHLGAFFDALLAGRLVTVVGAEANAADPDAADSMPSAEQVLAHLASRFACPAEHCRDLARAAQYVALTEGVGPLYDEIHGLFERAGAPGPVHRLLADLAAFVRERGGPRQLIVTTNFDDALERAFEQAGEEFDVVSYLALGRYRGKFLHIPADGPPTVVEVPNTYGELSLERRTVIFKIHGRIDRLPAREWESFVLSEDDHIDYLVDADLGRAVPVTLAARIRRSHFLFLGYPIEEWSLRVFLHRVWGQEKVAYRSWAVRSKADVIERELWHQRGVEVFDVPLEEYAEELRARLGVELSAGP